MAVLDWNSEEVGIGNEWRLWTGCAHVDHVGYSVLLEENRIISFKENATFIIINAYSKRA